MSLTVKAFLYRHSWNEEPVEIRRFSLDQDVSSNYAYLVQKIAQVFPSLPPDDVVVAWTDAEGDPITISSDEELLEALDQFDGTIFKIHLRRRQRGCAFVCHARQQPAFSEPPQETSQPSEEKEGEEGEEKTKEGAAPTEQTQSSGQQQAPQLHPGVVCDGCSSAIYGTRFKCLVCPDYDLCSACENKGLHVDHNMVTIHEPHSYNPWGFHHGPRHGGPWRCRGRGGRYRGGGHGHGWGPHGHSWGPHGHSWGPWAHPYFWRHLQHGAPPGCYRGQPTCARQPPKSSEAMETEQPAAESTQPQTEEQAQLEQEQRQSYLQDIGEAVSSFLRPFGVKVDVGVADGGPPKASADATPAPSAPTQVPSGSDSNTAYTPTLDPADPSQTTGEQAATVQYPTLPPSAGAEPEPDAIQQIVTQLRGMGFDDEGGWLTELAKAKGGDIGKVLDALHPSQTD